MKVKGKELRQGDIIEIWGKIGRDQIIKIKPYTGPYDFVCGIAEFAVKPVGMSIESESYYAVINR